ncbi:MAG: alpha-L-fucosidase [Lentisphaerae bacterium]|nr:alpha-L-fucosidase [Lentisphaerota bacterium]
MNEIARPSPGQLAWHAMELEMFVHLDPATWQSRHIDDHSTPLAAINPQSLDVEQWIDVARSFDAKQIILVAKHHGGFCWWPTRTSNYGVKETPWRRGKGDLVAELARACRRQGLRLGIYLSPQDSCFNAGQAGCCPTRAEQQRYHRVYRQQLTELLSLYGEIAEVWFDGSLVIAVADILQRYAPEAMIFQGPRATIRWVGNESGYAPYPAWNAVRARDALGGVATAAHGVPEGDVWLPLETDTPVREHYWFWQPNTESTLKSLAQLMEIYYRSVGHGTVLLLNSAPDTNGLIPEADAKRVAEFGAEIRRRFDQCLAETRGEGQSLTLSFAAPQAVDHVVTMEDIAQGERIREYVIEGETQGRWVELARGTAIGHKKIDAFAPQTVTALRLRVLHSGAETRVRRLAAYHTGLNVTIERAAEIYDPFLAGQWEVQAGTAWKTLVIDISRICNEARQYEIELKPDRGSAPIEVQAITLAVAGIAATGYVTAGANPLTWNMNITALGGEKSLRLVIRGQDHGSSQGKIMIRRQ